MPGLRQRPPGPESRKVFPGLGWGRGRSGEQPADSALPQRARLERTQADAKGVGSGGVRRGRAGARGLPDVPSVNPEALIRLTSPGSGSRHQVLELRCAGNLSLGCLSPGWGAGGTATPGRRVSGVVSSKPASTLPAWPQHRRAGHVPQESHVNGYDGPLLQVSDGNGWVLMC